LTLGDTVAHGRDTARKLGRPAGLAHRLLEQSGKALQRLMRREHVVIGRDNPHIGLLQALQACLVAIGCSGEGVREVGTRQAGANRPFIGRGLQAIEVGGTIGLAARLNPPGDSGHRGIEC